ncbi:MAG: SDR family oxidoreductase [Candidatus Omnitrophota bacterium]|nr:SDR family oxidoreductase [Candidatus Omnitrophota bacterium]MDZ4242869.1 SDR family oxidoreductase [Candidatus Omnitrophota bacterium]
MGQAKNKTKVLITGVSGLLGNSLARAWKDTCEILGIYCEHPWHLPGIETRKLDLLQESAVRKAIAEFQPQVLVHTAALTNVDVCEEQPQKAFDANVRVTQILVGAIGALPARLVHLSTDLVFDGAKGRYKENDPVAPLNVYARTKLEAEGAALKNSRALVARTNIFGWNVQNKRSLAEWVIDELSHKRRIKGFTDAVFSSIYTMDLADLLRAAWERELTGVYHVASSTAMNKYDFACRVADLFGLDKSLIEPSRVGDFAFKAKRAKDLSLDTSKLARALGRPVPTMEESLQRFRKDAEQRLRAG